MRAPCRLTAVQVTMQKLMQALTCQGGKWVCGRWRQSATQQSVQAMLLLEKLGVAGAGGRHGRRAASPTYCNRS